MKLNYTNQGFDVKTVPAGVGRYRESEFDDDTTLE